MANCGPDPSGGRVARPRSTVGVTAGGSARAVAGASAAGSTPAPERRLLAYDRGAGARLWLAIAAGIAAVAAVVLGAVLMSEVVASVFLDGKDLAAAACLVVALALLAAVRAILLWGHDVLAQGASTRLRRRLRSDLTSRLFALGPGYTSAERTGELATVLTSGLDDIDVYVAAFQPARVLAVAAPLLVLAVVLVLDPPTAVVLIATGPVLVLLLGMIGSRTGSLSERRFAELRWMSAFFLDLLSGMATLKMFGRSAEQVGSIRAVSRRFGETTMEVLRTAFQTALVLEWGAAVAMAVVAVEVSLRLMDGTIPFQRALAVLIVCPEFFLPLRQLAVRYHTGSAGRTAAARVFAILDTPAAASADRPARAVTTGAVAAGAVAEDSVAQDTAGRPASSGLGGPARTAPTIVFERVAFTYTDRSAAAIDDLTFTIPARARTALVGTTGAGKTTIVKLLLRFAAPDAGTILVDGHDLADINVASWRAAIGWVPQTPHLFHGTVADNLRLGRPDAMPDELERAARDAGAHEFIVTLPGGYDAPVGEDGLRLSGGQRQRLALARAILRDAPVLLLDEPTAHLDRRGEAMVAETLERLAHDRTVLIVTHRASLASTADAAVVLQHGRIVEAGAPATLLTSGGAFAALMAAGDDTGDGDGDGDGTPA